MTPAYPIFVPTKGRHGNPLTIKALERLSIPYTAVIEKQEWKAYSERINPRNILVVPHANEGLTVTRNWIWDYAQNELKSPYFWTMDDNIRDFYRLHKNIKFRLTSGTFLAAIEEFAQRYKNLFICGMAYELFTPRKSKVPAFVTNTRIYSNMLIRTDIPFRNQLFFNDDTDLCLRILKSGACTVQFNAFLIDKAATMTIKGGMTDYYDKTDKRLEFAKELQRAHPDVMKVTWKFNRWHHQVDYQGFKQRLIRKPGLSITKGVDNYGMKLQKKVGDFWKDVE